MESSILTNLKALEIAPGESTNESLQERERRKYQERRKQRRFYIFLDYSNFLGALESEEQFFEELKSLENEIVKVGTIEFASAYIPSNRFNEAPIMFLSNVLDYEIIGCSLQTSGGVLKNADTVDMKMERKIWAMMFNSNVTDFVIITGDADFQPGTVWIGRHQKKVLILSGKRALSTRYRQLEGLDNITIKEV